MSWTKMLPSSLLWAQPIPMLINGLEVRQRIPYDLHPLFPLKYH